MNKFLLFFILLLTASLSFGQYVDRVTQILRLTKVKETVDQMTEVYIQKFQNSYPDVSKERWATIRQTIDHSAFINDVDKLYRTNYSEAELHQLVKTLQAGDHTKFYELTKKTEDMMYTMSKEYGKSVSNKIFEMMNKK